MEIRCIHQARSALGEGALWVPEEKALYWLDQIRPEIHRLDPATREDVRFPLALPAQLGALGRHEGGGFMLAPSDGVSLLSADMRSPTGFNNPNCAQPQATVDAEGFLWTTHWGGWRITRFAPDGRVDREIAMPVKSITSCAFGGDAMDTLFVTTASIELEQGRWVFMDEAGFAAAPTTGGI